jgi:FdhD protein
LFHLSPAILRSFEPLFTIPSILEQDNKLQVAKLYPTVELNSDGLTAYNARTVAQFTPAGVSSLALDILTEEPLSIRVQGKPYAIVMRTPGDEIAHVAGFCLGEGIIDAYDDIKQIAYCDAGTNVVTVTLTAARLLKAGVILERRGFISQSSCGICGKEVVQDLIQTVRPLQDTLRVEQKQLMACYNHFSDHQLLYAKTHTSHAAVAFDADFHPQTAGEDVGRHNAVDKAVGQLLIHGGLVDTVCMLLSSRISYELIQKVGRARIPIVMALSRPTVLAVELAQKLNISLIYISSDDTLVVYSATHRIIVT